MWILDPATDCQISGTSLSWRSLRNERCGPPRSLRDAPAPCQSSIAATCCPSCTWASDFERGLPDRNDHRDVIGSPPGECTRKRTRRLSASRSSSFDYAFLSLPLVAKDRLTSRSNTQSHQCTAGMALGWHKVLRVPAPRSPRGVFSARRDRHVTAPSRTISLRAADEAREGHGKPRTSMS